METLGTQLSLFDDIAAPVSKMVGSLDALIGSFDGVKSAADQINAADLLTTMNKNIMLSNDALEKMGKSFKAIVGSIKDNSSEQKKFNEEVKKGPDLLKQLQGGFMKLAATAGAYLSARVIVGGAVGFAKESLALAKEQLTVENKLETVLGNQGKQYRDFVAYKEGVEQASKESGISETALLAGATELATYMTDAEAVKKMVGTLGNYAAGMTDKLSFSTQEMTELATQLGKVTMGAYDGISKKGFSLNEQQKEIIKSGTDMQKAIEIEKIIAENWGSLADNLSKISPEQKTINSWDGLKTKIGMQMQPVVANFFGTINQNMPKIEEAVLGLGPVLEDITKIMVSMGLSASDSMLEATNSVGGFYAAWLKTKNFLATTFDWVLITLDTIAATLDTLGYGLLALPALINKSLSLVGLQDENALMPEDIDRLIAERWKSVGARLDKAEEDRLNRGGEIDIATGNVVGGPEAQKEQREEERLKREAEREAKWNERWGNVKAIASNTGEGKNLTKDNLKYLRDIAERDIIYRHTSQAVTVHQTNSFSSASQVDMTGVVNHMARAVRQASWGATEGDAL